MNECLIIGVGNEFRCDDGVGFEVARQLAKLGLPGVTVLELSGEGTALMEWWQDAGKVIIVDAAVSGAEAGHIHRIMIGRDPIPQRLLRSFSSHAFGVAGAVQLAQQLGRLPEKLTIYGIEGICFDMGEGLSAESPDVRIASRL